MMSIYYLRVTSKVKAQRTHFLPAAAAPWHICFLFPVHLIPFKYHQRKAGTYDMGGSLEYILPSWSLDLNLNELRKGNMNNYENARKKEMEIGSRKSSSSSSAWLMRRVVLGIGFWMQGMRCYPWMGVIFFLKDTLRLDPSSLQILQTSSTLPMVAKPFIGLLSDSFYICGHHRLPYIAVGGTTFFPLKVPTVPLAFFIIYS